MTPNRRLLMLLSLCLIPTAHSAPSFVPNDQPRGWLGTPAMTSYVIKSGKAVLFRSNYDLKDWSGDVIASYVDSSAEIGGDSPWGTNTATKLIDAQHYDSGRKIVTLKSDGSKIAFRWGNLSTTQQTALGNATNGPKILDFIRGDRSNEAPNGLNLRTRKSVLGDIIHSPLVYWRYNASTGRLFFGGNDGMVHVLDTATGQEVFAYIPSMLISNLNKLAANPYQHTYFVDGGMSIAQVSSVGGSKIILVGALGAGGRGLYALDMTDPSAADEAAAAAKIMWEIQPSTTGYANLGYTYGTPRIARLKNGTAVVIAGNGYMNEGDGKASLFIINIETGALIREISTGVNGSGGPNGLSTPTLVDVDNDGRVDHAYAGDLDGTLWKFDLNHEDPANFQVTSLHTTSPAQAITVAPVVRRHPLGGYMVMFATGRTLSSADLSDNSIHYVYGIWDGAGSSNTTLVDQSFTETTFGSLRVRYLTAHKPDWSTHKGWRTALPAGERVLGEFPFYNNGRYYFASTNPTVTNASPPHGATWLNELDYLSGGESPSLIFELTGDGVINDADKVNGHVVVSKYLGAGIISQPVLIDTATFSNTVFNSHPNALIEVNDPNDPGVSGGHFDFDIYYGNITTAPTSTGVCQTRNNVTCKKSSEMNSQLGTLSSYCSTANGFSTGYGYFSSYTSGASCGKKDEFQQNITCCQYTTTPTVSAYAKKKHVHEYDDKYDVTGVNMLNASEPAFNLSNAIPDQNLQFKILVMNQYLNPAATLMIGPGSSFTSVKDYQGLASQTDAAALLAGLPIYSRANIGTMVFNLPLDAFKSKDWWGDGGTPRAGLIPTQTGCVNKVNADGSPSKGSKAGPNGERYNGALTLQLIRHDTPASALELNYPDGGPKYGWRVKQSQFTTYVLAEYTVFWHHDNKKCYGDSGWVPNPPEDTSPPGTKLTPAAGSEDPKFGTFVAGASVVSITTTTSGNTTTTEIRYSDGKTYTRMETQNPDGTRTITQILPDGTTITTIVPAANGNVIFGGEESALAGGRVTWRELLR